MSIGEQLALTGLVMFFVGFVFDKLGYNDTAFKTNIEKIYSVFNIISYLSVPVLLIIAIWI